MVTNKVVATPLNTIKTYILW